MTWVQIAASKRIAITSVDSYACLWSLKDFLFRAGSWGPGSWDVISTDPTTGALCSQAVCVVKSLHTPMLISHVAGTPRFFGSRRGIREVFAEELLQKTRCFLVAHKGQVPLHQEAYWGQLSRHICSTNLFHGPTLWRKAYAGFSALDFPRLSFGDFPGLFSCPEVIPLSAVQPQSKKTRSAQRTCSHNKSEKWGNEPNQQEFPGVRRNSESVWPGDKQRFQRVSLLPLCWRVLIHRGSWWNRVKG